MVRRGNVLGLIGLNGAGKTIRFLLLLGLTKPRLGEMQVLGLNGSLRTGRGEWQSRFSLRVLLADPRCHGYT
ncbi:MAG: ATP-binding cassette domain-containing protein [Oscillochloris sp.]|nr:ATP-binding cassette domain-containing protein [Oscillochloris sp.]